MVGVISHEVGGSAWRPDGSPRPPPPADATAVTAGPSPKRNARRRRRSPLCRAPRCPRADRGAPSPELPFRRLGPDSVPPPARAPPVGCRATSRARGSAWIRRPPRGSRPGPRASPAGPTELTLAEPETARAPGVATHHYSKRFRVTGGFRGCHRMPHTARRKGTQPRGYLS